MIRRQTISRWIDATKVILSFTVQKTKMFKLCPLAACVCSCLCLSSAGQNHFVTR